MGSTEQGSETARLGKRSPLVDFESISDKNSTSTVGRNLYAFLVCAWVAVGLGISAFGAWISLGWQVTLLLWLSVLALTLIGVVIALLTKQAIISFIGYLLMAFPSGLLLGPIVNTYTEASVLRIFLVTIIFTVALGILGAIIPASLEGCGVWLFAGLLVLFVGYLAVPIMGMLGMHLIGAMTFLDWFGVFLFCGYIVYDLNRAMRVPYTLNNSIVSAIALYLDFSNLFIRLLALFGKKKP